MEKKSESKDKVTKHIAQYPEGEKPDTIVPEEYGTYRYVLGRKGTDPLVVICMNPSAANEKNSDRTINRVISISKILGKDGWFVLNLYPERATNAKNITDTSKCERNVQTIQGFLLENGVKEVWGAWGNTRNIHALEEGKKQLLQMLHKIGVKCFYYGKLTKAGNPRHPLQRSEVWDFSESNRHEFRLTEK